MRLRCGARWWPASSFGPEALRLRLEPLASADHAAVVAAVVPNPQRYPHGPLDGPREPAAYRCPARSGPEGGGQVVQSGGGGDRRVGPVQAGGPHGHPLGPSGKLVLAAPRIGRRG
jgi:hypothetical protein